MNAAAATYAGVDHDKVAAFLVIHHAIRRVVLLVITDIHLLRANFTGVSAVPITPGIVLHVVNLEVGVRPLVLKILLRLAVKRF